VRPYLLDTNVLIALAWPSHVHHAQAQGWFAKKRRAGFRTCPITETGFVRISSNPRFTRDAVSPRHALALLERVAAIEGYEFWPDDLPVSSAIGGQSIVGHRQVADAYLLALAMARGGRLATLDRGVLSLPLASVESVEMVLNS
jgi:hypothetical protein